MFKSLRALQSKKNSCFAIRNLLWVISWPVKCADLLYCLDNELIIVVISNVCMFVYIYRYTPIATEVCSSVKAGLMILVRIILDC